MADSGKRPIEDLAQEMKLPAWEFEGMKRHYRWGVGRLMTDAEFSAAVETARKLPASKF